MLSNINNLEELLAEKARLRKQLEIVQGEMDESAKRTRQELRLFSDGADQVYVLTWPGPLFRSHWEQRLTATGRRKRM